MEMKQEIIDKLTNLKKIGKEKDKSCQQNCPQGTQNRFLMFSIDQLHFQ